jgi:hypothetical protein
MSQHQESGLINSFEDVFSSLSEWDANRRRVTTFLQKQDSTKLALLESIKLLNSRTQAVKREIKEIDCELTAVRNHNYRSAFSSKISNGRNDMALAHMQFEREKLESGMGELDEELVAVNCSIESYRARSLKLMGMSNNPHSAGLLASTTLHDLQIKAQIELLRTQKAEREEVIVEKRATASASFIACDLTDEWEDMCDHISTKDTLLLRVRAMQAPTALCKSCQDRDAAVEDEHHQHAQQQSPPAADGE